MTSGIHKNRLIFLFLQHQGKVELDKADDLLCKSKPSPLTRRQHHEETHNNRFHGMILVPLILLLLELREKLGVSTLGIAALKWFEKSSLVADERFVSDNWPNCLAITKSLLL